MTSFRFGALQEPTVRIRTIAVECSNGLRISTRFEFLNSHDFNLDIESTSLTLVDILSTTKR